MCLSTFLADCDSALQLLAKQRGRPWHIAGTWDSPPGAYRLALDCLRRLVETAICLAPADNLPPVEMVHVKSLHDENIATAILRVKQLKHWAVSLSVAEVALASQSTQIDDDAYRPANKLLKPDGWPKNFKELNAALKAHPEIRTRRPLSTTGKPLPNRLDVHLLDWAKYEDQREATTPDPLDLPPETVDRAVQDVARRKAEIDGRRKAAE
jgi:hypothetical protein